MLSALTRAMLLCCVVACSPVSVAHAIAVMTVGSQRVVPGGGVDLGVELVVHEDMHSFEVVLGYDPELLSITSHLAGELLTEWGSEGLTFADDAEAGTLTVVGTSHGDDPVGWVSGELLALRFAVSDDAPIAAVLPIAVESAGFFDTSGTALLSFTEDGAITILDPEAEPEPEPPVFAVALPDVEAQPGEALWLEVELDNPAPFLALALELWVDGSVISLDPARTAELAERAAGAVSAVEVMSADVLSIAIAASDGDALVPAGTGEVIRIPLLVSETAEAGVRSLMVTSTAAMDGEYAAIEVTGGSCILTITDEEVGDTGEVSDTGLDEDTGLPADTGDLPDTGEPSDDDLSDTGDGPADPGGVEAEDAEVSLDTPDKDGCGCGAVGRSVGGLLTWLMLSVVVLRRRL